MIGIKRKAIQLLYYIRKPLVWVENEIERAWRPNRIINLESVFSLFSTSDVTFLQIGANDGMTNDKLRNYIIQFGWNGILVEPVPYVFERLKRNYTGTSNLFFENCAIAERSGEMIFYALKEFDDEGKHVFYDFTDYKIDQLGSFNRKTLLKHSYMHPDLESLIIELPVRTTTIGELIDKYNFTDLDILLIDAEGYDDIIVKSIDFTRVMPTVIIFEHHHLKRKEYREVVVKLKQYYRLYVDGWDTVALRYDFDKLMSVTI
ncbi:MAG: FkbM family methyltransferase [Lacibacter sp.]